MAEKKTKVIDLGDVDVDQFLTTSGPANGASTQPSPGKSNDFDFTLDSVVADNIQTVPARSDGYDLSLQNPDESLSSLHDDMIYVAEGDGGEDIKSALSDNPDYIGKADRRKKLAIGLGGGLLAFAASYFAYVEYTAVSNSSESFVEEGFVENAMPVESTSVEPKETSILQTEPKELQKKWVDPISGIDNPYWPLPNRLAPTKGKVLPISNKLEETWMAGLKSPFVYQHYKTVQLIRGSRNKNAAYLLLEALNSPKLWTRMSALIGLAELGVPVNINTVTQALGNATSWTIFHYLHRFQKRVLSGGELYVLRQVLRLVDGKARLIILQTLDALGGDINHLYLIAARYDPSRQIKSWLFSRNVRSSLPLALVNRYREIAMEYISVDSAVYVGEASVEEQEAVTFATDSQDVISEVRAVDSEEKTGASALIDAEVISDGFRELIDKTKAVSN